jgi:hypothetical protein
MDLDELKSFLKVDGNALDVVLIGYQLGAEEYLKNAGVAKDYTNALYKVIVTIICGTLLENPSLLVNGKGSLGSLEITLNAFITQLRLSQVAT